MPVENGVGKLSGKRKRYITGFMTVWKSYVKRLGKALKSRRFSSLHDETHKHYRCQRF